MNTSVIPPGEGERRAQRGYGRQYESSGAAIYAALNGGGDLLWIGVADRSAGIADDLVLGFSERVVGHQFKTSQFPEKFTLKTLLMGADGLLKPLTDAWQYLKSTNPGEGIETCVGNMEVQPKGTSTRIAPKSLSVSVDVS